MHQEKDDQQWEEALKQHFQTCPQCGEVWLVFGLLENENYTCQTCRHCFSILRAYGTEAAAPNRQKRRRLRSN